MQSKALRVGTVHVESSPMKLLSLVAKRGAPKRKAEDDGDSAAAKLTPSKPSRMWTKCTACDAKHCSDQPCPDSSDDNDDVPTPAHHKRWSGNNTTELAKSLKQTVTSAASVPVLDEDVPLSSDVEEFDSDQEPNADDATAQLAGGMGRLH